MSWLLWVSFLKMVVYDVLRDLAFWVYWCSRGPHVVLESSVRSVDGGEMRLHYFFEPSLSVRKAKEEQPVVLVLHGLTGHGLDSYTLELARGAQAAGFDVVSATRRGCGDLKFTSAVVSHAAAEADVALLVEALAPLKRPVVLYAASFGGLLAYRYAANLRSPSVVVGLVAVCPLLSPSQNAKFIKSTGSLGRLVDRAVAHRLHTQFIKARYPGSLARAPPKTVRAFDEAVVCPSAGFKDADDYYRAADASSLAPPQIPCLLITAKDDPILDGTLKPTNSSKLLEVKQTKTGSHCGDPRGFFAQLQTTFRGGRGSGHAIALKAFINNRALPFYYEKQQDGLFSNAVTSFCF